ncbi:Hypothetical protein NCS54_00630800 [Fusarium falciforme]|uniref:Hypothetical protein n=1 Tax=Fusarium falciforme TaxID=195108 RepID=UPI0023010176|nr:Hypothetical protein NCS54_00630800 [Fusarium falciforme]WAO88939.1 Hypothetical protein NCS54_00630800 [Fusarium falciforme]
MGSIPTEHPKIRIAIDRGGTFTDVHAYVSNTRHEQVFKLLSVDPKNYKDAPTEGIRRVQEKFRGTVLPREELIDTWDIESIRMGTTIATNALLERQGERAALLTTKGFRDLLVIGNQARPHIFDLTVRKLENLYETVVEIDERVTMEEFLENPGKQPIDISKDSALVEGSTGEVVRILQVPDMKAIKVQLEQLYSEGFRSLAICFMHAYLYPNHDNSVAKLAREMGFDVSVSSELQPTIKMVPRGNSATADAYLSPLIKRYVKNFGTGFKGGVEVIAGKILFMQSDGGLCLWQKFSGLRAILSGPAGGVIGYAKSCYDAGEKRPLLGFDMGGTSTDVSRFAGTYDHVFETETAEVTLQVPQLDINTVAAGGGSILHWKNGLFAIGPDVNIPSLVFYTVCYRKGGPLTVTDANLFLGRLLPESFPAIFGPNEDEPLDYEATAKAFAEMTHMINSEEGLDFTPEEVASGFLRMANEAMSRPVRSLTEGRGIRTSDHTLVTFGGAGGQHACDVAEALGIDMVAIHRFSSILSAYGIALGDLTHEVQRPRTDTLANMEKNIEAEFAPLVNEASTILLQQGFPAQDVEYELFLNLRYAGTNSSLMIRKPVDSWDFASIFTRQHHDEFGFTLDREILVDDIRVRALGKTRGHDFETISQALKSVPTNMVSPKKSVKKTKLYTAGVWSDVNLYRLDDLAPGDLVQGPSVILDQTQTILVQPGWSATVLPRHLVLEKALQSASKTEEEDESFIDPIQLSVFGHRFMSIAEQMGDVLVSNHPAAGGSHLPDVNVITPVIDDQTNEVLFWVASRAHHAGIGGICAGSMPPHSKEIWQEGASFTSFKLIEYPGCTGTRTWSDNVSDLKAQDAANLKGIRLIQDCIKEYGLSTVQKYMNGIQANAEKIVRSLLRKVHDEFSGLPLEAVDYLDDGSMMCLKIHIDREQGSATVDFTGTTGELYGNLNAPRAITFSAIIYVLRSLVNEDIPLNQGCLAPIDVILPEGTFLSPSKGAATVGGNTDTSQRVTDLVLQAFQAAAASQGTCNNLTFGYGGVVVNGTAKPGFGYYETIAGGSGAGPTWAGQSGVHVHMTNTRITDPESLEKRYPCILHELSIRKGSGGAGKYAGGDGCIRDIEFRRPVQVSVLSERRSIPPPGIQGGGPGKRGENIWVTHDEYGAREIMLGGKNTCEMKKGDRIIIRALVVEVMER